MFAEDRHGAAPQIRASLESGKTVLLDRYVYSNIAYQCAKLSSPEERERLRDWIFRTEYGDFNLPRPDVNLFLDVPISFVRESLASARQGSDRDYLEGGKDIHEANISFQETVRSMYVDQTRRDPDFLRVDCSDDIGDMLPPDAISERVRAAIDTYLDRV